MICTAAKGISSGKGVAVLVGGIVLVGVGVIVDVTVGGLVSVAVGDRVARTVRVALWEGLGESGKMVSVGGGVSVFVLLGWAAAVCETIAFAVMAITVGSCSSGIKVGNGSASRLNLQPLSKLIIAQKPHNHTIFLTICLSGIFGGVFINNCQ
jgi:hypothetical protein